LNYDTGPHKTITGLWAYDTVFLRSNTVPEFSNVIKSRSTTVSHWGVLHFFCMTAVFSGTTAFFSRTTAIFRETVSSRRELTA
jgi:hypothetical protein